MSRPALSATAHKRRRRFTTKATYIFELTADLAQLFSAEIFERDLSLRRGHDTATLVVVTQMEATV